MKNLKILSLTTALMGLAAFLPTDIFASTTASSSNVEEGAVEVSTAPCSELPPELWQNRILHHLTPGDVASFSSACAAYNEHVTEPGFQTHYCEIEAGYYRELIDKLPETFMISSADPVLPADFVEGLQLFLRGEGDAFPRPYFYANTLKQLFLPETIGLLGNDMSGYKQTIFELFPPKTNDVYDKGNIVRAFAVMAAQSKWGEWREAPYGKDDLEIYCEELKRSPLASVFLLAEYMPKVCHGGLYAFYIGDILKALAKAPSGLIPDIAQCAVMLSNPANNVEEDYDDTEGCVMHEIINELVKAPIDSLETLKVYGKNFLVEDLSNAGQLTRVKALCEFPTPILNQLFRLEEKSSVTMVDRLSLLAQHVPLSHEMIEVLKVHAPSLFTAKMTELERFQILDNLAKTSPQTFSFVAAFSSIIFSSNIDGSDVVETIKALNKALSTRPLLDFPPLIDFIKHCITESTDHKKLTRFCEIISEVSVRRLAAVQQYLPLFRTDEIYAPALAEGVLELLSQPFMAKMSELDVANIAKVLAEAPVASLGKIAHYAPHFMSEYTTQEGRIALIKAIVPIPAETLAMIVESAPIFKEMDTDLMQVLPALAQVPPALFHNRDSLTVFAKCARIFMNRSYNESGSKSSVNASIIKALSSLSASRMKCLAQLESEQKSSQVIDIFVEHGPVEADIRQAIETHRSVLCTHSMDSLQIFCALNALSKCSVAEIAAIAGALPGLGGRSPEGWYRVRVIEGLAQVIPGEVDRTAGVKKFLENPFFTRGQWPGYRVMLPVDLIAQAPLDVLRAIEDHLDVLLSGDGIFAWGALPALLHASVSAEHVHGIADLVSFLFTEEKIKNSGSFIGSILAQASGDSVRCIAGNSSIFFTQEMDDDARLTLISALAPLSPASIHAIAHHEALQKRESASVRKRLIIRLAKEYREAEAYGREG